MLEVTTSWTIPSGIATKSVMYFANGTTLATARERVWGVFNGVTTLLSAGVAFSVDQQARVLDPVTGTLTGLESDATSRTGTGSGATLNVADATQVLLRWFTGTVVGGRFVQGRTFVPGLDGNLVQNGNLSPAAQADFLSSVNDMLSPSVGFGVWHRPKGGAGGQHLLATEGAVNSELAVLRRRRNR